LTSLVLHPDDLEPSLVADRTYTSRRRLGRIDSTALLSVMIVLLAVLPPRIVVPTLTNVGRPAMVMGLLLFSWWLVVRLNPRLTMTGPQPLRWAVLILLASTMMSYAAGFIRGLPALEANGADLALIWTLQFVGVILIAADGIPNWERLYGVLRVFVCCSGLIAVVGLVQFVFRWDVTQYIVVPGMQLKGDLIGFQDRGGGGLVRVASTTTHYIEFSTVMAMSLPYAIHLARFSSTARARQLFAVMAVLAAAAIPVTLSRTGIVALAVVALVMVPTWNWRMRYNMLILSGALLAALMVVRPGLLGTLTSLFEDVDSDPSISGRTEDYAIVSHYFAQHPWLGRGAGTFIPSLYIILDNQWLATAITTGVLGVAALALLHLTCISLAAIAMRRSKLAPDRHLCAALISTQLIAMVVAGTFDSLGFSTFAFALASLMGICGAVWRFTHPARTIRTSTVPAYSGRGDERVSG
jgi:O-antigen ligase